ncbi:MAG: hypothetical protein KIS67_07730 [Verrucomicrobiae bacterium]|nr:hypothetical protein [Verrucomicrobiae bacterium]
MHFTEFTTEDFSRHAMQARRPVLLALSIAGSPADEKMQRLLESWSQTIDGCLDIVVVRTSSPCGISHHGIALGAPGLALFQRGAISYQFLGEVSRRELDDVLNQVILFNGLEDQVCLPGDANWAADR